jgi:glutamate synthase domain-containing protein 2/glutamate synthase domain-containing protein 3
MLEIARADERSAKDLTADEREKNVIHALEQGLLKIMSKMGISVVRSYQSAKLFTVVGLGPKLVKEFFPGLQSPLGGYELDEIVELVLNDTAYLMEEFNGKYKPMQTYQYKEHAKDGEGERHSMTRKRSLLIHDLIRKSEGSLSLDNMDLYQAYLENHEEDKPVHIRNLFSLIKAEKETDESQLETVEDIVTRFGSGAMSFGAISAESQRDIFQAFNELGGRSNSGEGGENPYYFTDGISATTKQIASGRFGVTAEYLVTGNEIQIKVAQGAKPGEGGQLMGIKVNADIAKARYANEGVSLISPPPLHDIYSIEDLKELIYELKQVNPKAKVCVKLVSGAHIGTIAVGVAKAGADVIHVSGGDGGTGAASLSSMKHAGLPWELGLFEVHQALIENNLRTSIILRTDGGLSTGIDIIMAAIFGAEEFDFGKMLLIAEGCVMARICEKNTCPTGIATHDPKFKAKYAGNKEQVKIMLKYLANDVRRHLKYLGCTTIDDLLGRVDLLEANKKHFDFINKRKLRLNYFLDGQIVPFSRQKSLFKESVSFLNQQLLSDTASAIEQNKDYSNSYLIQATDRAALSTLSGKLALLQSQARRGKATSYKKELTLSFNGSAGQGFGVFLNEGLRVYLYGEANDSVAKGMSGGFMAIRPVKKAIFEADQNTIIGNVALYGATGGKIFINGLAGDRFAVRNSGATAVVEGTGLHACEYMTNGKVVILGKTSDNVGGGMTGGELILFEDQPENINTEYLGKASISDADLNELKRLLEEYVEETQSNKWRRLLGDWSEVSTKFVKYLPLSKLKEKSEVEDTKSK